MSTRTWNAVWDGRPAEYAAKRDCWLTHRRALYVADFLRKASKGDRVLELGSGVGDLLIALSGGRPDLHFTGIDPQQSYVEYAAEAADRAGVRSVAFHTASAEDVDRALPGGTQFDWILSNDVLHHVSDFARVLDAAAAVAHGGTRWLAIEPNVRNPYSLLSALVRRGERNFWPAPFLSRARARGWACRNRDYLFLVPPFIRRAPRFLVELEKKLERVPLLAGGVALTLLRVPAESGQRTAGS